MGGDSSLNSLDYYSNYCEQEKDNLPMPRGESRASWLESGKFFWFYGGRFTSNYSQQELSDMWYYDLENKIWIWVNGNTLTNNLPEHGSQGVYSINNHPGARCGSVSWNDNQNNLWLYGGHYSNGASPDYYGDLWKFIPVKCEFISVNEILREENEIKISPNPFSDHTNFSFPSSAYLNSTLTFYNIMGQIAKELKVDQEYMKIHRDQMSPGIYLYMIMSDKGIIKSGKFIIE
ncbi:MAG: T9SS type A sorting domain-containing protein [Chitinophagales bacterium]